MDHLQRLEVFKPSRRPIGDSVAPDDSGKSLTGQTLLEGETSFDSVGHEEPRDFQAGLNVLDSISDVQAQPKTLSEKVVARCFQPSFFISLSVHLAILLILAFWMLPGFSQSSLLVFAEQLPEAKIEDVEMVMVELESEDFELENELEFDESMPVDMEHTVDLEDFESGTPDDFGFSGELVEHNAEMMAVEGSTEGTNRNAVLSEAAQGIQQKVIEAGGKSGEVQFSLVWKTLDDVDIHVVSPGGHRIHYRDRSSNCGGLLDVDRNANDGNTTNEPVENIRWLNGRPQEGRYTVMIHLYRMRSLLPVIGYDLMAKTGQTVELEKGRLSPGSRLHVFRYIYVSDKLSENARASRIERYESLQEREEKLASGLLDNVAPGSSGESNRLWAIIRKYPHTDAAIEALQRLGRSGNKY
jgi:hypothetical protein